MKKKRLLALLIAMTLVVSDFSENCLTAHAENLTEAVQTDIEDTQEVENSVLTVDESENRKETNEPDVSENQAVNDVYEASEQDETLEIEEDEENLYEAVSGTYGDISWSYVKGVLTVAGTGNTVINADFLDDICLGSYVTSVTIGNGIKEIGDYAFDNCSGLTSVTISTIKPQTYKGKALTPGFKVTFKKSSLKAGRDYTVTWTNNNEKDTASVTITGTGNYTGSTSLDFVIQ